MASGTVSSAVSSPAAAADIYIGTAGYNYSHWRRGKFYPIGLAQSRELRHFSGVFSAVEINASFHGIPREETLKGWRTDAKSGFRFALKVPQEITHARKLSGIEGPWGVFIGRATNCLETALGPVLFQLPPSLAKDIKKLDDIAKLVPCGVQVAFEFRHPSWYSDDVFEAMRNHGFAVCENVSPDDSTYRTSQVTADWCYIRFHKNGDRLVTNYTDEQLAVEADRIVERRRRGLAQHIFFLNDHEGNGPKNARTLMRLVVERLGQNSTPRDLVHGWKPDAVVEKGGKGSIVGMFAAAQAKSPPATKRKATPNLDDVGKAKKSPKQSMTPKVALAAKKSTPDKKKGNIMSFFTKKN